MRHYLITFTAAGKRRARSVRARSHAHAIRSLLMLVPKAIILGVNTAI